LGRAASSWGLDTQVEVNSCPQQLLDLRARSGAYFAQPGTAFADHKLPRSDSNVSAKTMSRLSGERLPC